MVVFAFFVDACTLPLFIVSNRNFQIKIQVRVGNTDAEGRMAMADCLCEAKEHAVNAVNPQIYTIATLTGHAIIAMGPGYSVSVITYFSFLLIS